MQRREAKSQLKKKPRLNRWHIFLEAERASSIMTAMGGRIFSLLTETATEMLRCTKMKATEDSLTSRERRSWKFTARARVAPSVITTMMEGLMSPSA